MRFAGSDGRERGAVRGEASRGSGEPSTSAPVPAPAAPGGFSLTDLTPEVLLRVLLSLSAQDLSSCAQACKGLHGLCEEDFLWKRLYHFRWGVDARVDSSEVVDDGKPSSWHRIYLDRARSTLRDALAACDAGMGQHITQMHAHLWENPPNADFSVKHLGFDSSDPAAYFRASREAASLHPHRQGGRHGDDRDHYR